MSHRGYQFTVIKLTRPTLSQSVTQTRSTDWTRASKLSFSNRDDSVNVSTATRGFRLSTRDLAACTLWSKRRKNYKTTRGETKRNRWIIWKRYQTLFPLTFFPTSSSLKKNPAPRSSAETSWSSTMINFPIPAKTMFLIASVATPLRRTTSIVAFRILTRWWVWYYALFWSRYATLEGLVLTFVELPVPIVESGDHTTLPHLKNISVRQLLVWSQPGVDEKLCQATNLLWSGQARSSSRRRTYLRTMTPAGYKLL